MEQKPCTWRFSLPESSSQSIFVISETARNPHPSCLFLAETTSRYLRLNTMHFQSRSRGEGERSRSLHTLSLLRNLTFSPLFLNLFTMLPLKFYSFLLFFCTLFFQRFIIPVGKKCLGDVDLFKTENPVISYNHPSCVRDV